MFMMAVLLYGPARYEAGPNSRKLGSVGLGSRTGGHGRCGSLAFYRRIFQDVTRHAPSCYVAASGASLSGALLQHEACGLWARYFGEAAMKIISGS